MDPALRHDPALRLDPAPQRRHPDRQVGETYRDAVSRLAGERDAALRDVERIDRERAYYADQLLAVTTGLQPLCAHGGESDCSERGCPIHGDGEAFAAHVRALEHLAQTVERKHVLEHVGLDDGGHAEICAEDGYAWPCDTRTALDGPA